MVYTSVSIYRGYLIDKNLTKALMNDRFGIQEEDEELSKWDDTRELANFDGVNNPCTAVLIGGCCSTNRDIIVGCKIAEYSRKKFEWDNNNLPNRDIVETIRAERAEQAYFKNNNGYFCGSIMDETDSTYRCGRYGVCDRCIGETTNGFYPVRDILEKTVECTTYCFRCNKDKCTAHPHQINDSEDTDFIFTTDKAVDGLLKDFCDNYNNTGGISLPPIKNYYVLDDCLSCT